MGGGKDSRQCPTAAPPSRLPHSSAPRQRRVGVSQHFHPPELRKDNPRSLFISYVQISEPRPKAERKHGTEQRIHSVQRRGRPRLCSGATRCNASAFGEGAKADSGRRSCMYSSRTALSHAGLLSPQRDPRLPTAEEGWEAGR